MIRRAFLEKRGARLSTNQRVDKTAGHSRAFRDQWLSSAVRVGGPVLGGVEQYGD